MSLKSTSTNYGTVAIAIHWLSVVFIFIMIGSGLRAAGMTDGAAKAAVLWVHVPLGVIVMLLTLARVAWWLFADKKPPAPQGDPAWQTKSANAVHILFYIVIFGMAASGIGMMVLSGAGAIMLDNSTTPLPNFWDYLPRVPHGIGSRLLILLVIVHAGAALYHHFVKKDGLLNRMWFGRQ